MMCHFRKHVFPSLFLPSSICSTNAPTPRYSPKVLEVCRQRVSCKVLSLHFNKDQQQPRKGWFCHRDEDRLLAPTAPNTASSAPPAGSSQLRRDIPALDCIHNPSSHSCWRTQIQWCSGTGLGQKHSGGASLSVGNCFCLEPKPNSTSWPTFSSKVSREQNKWKGVGNNLSE